MKENFLRELEHLLDEVPSDQWQDPQVCGVRYSFLPWHAMSTITVQVQEDDPRDPASWKYYFSAESDSTRLREEIALYDVTCETDSYVYHRLLIEAAEALLAVDFGKHMPDMVTVTGFELYKPFQVQVHHADRVFGFNYCEYVLARRLEAL